MTGALKMVAMKKMKLTMMVTNLRMATATRIDKNDDEREEAHEEAQEEKEARRRRARRRRGRGGRGAQTGNQCASTCIMRAAGCDC